MNTYLFDFDGTLVDSMPTYVSGLLKIMEDNRIPVGEDFVKVITPLGIEGSIEYCIRLGLPLSVEEGVRQMKENIREAYFHDIPAKPHVVETLCALKARGADLNVLTASPHLTLDACLKRLGIFDLFTNVWSCEDFATTKADPAIYRMAAEKLGKPVGEILFLDDNLNADKTAKVAGMRVCGVYDEYSRDYVEEMKRVADHYVYDLSELLAI